MIESLMSSAEDSDGRVHRYPLGTDCWRFGGYVLDCARMELEHDGRRIRLEERTMRVLVCLLEHADSIVTRATLLAGAWPGQVVSDSAIARAVMKLRVALGGDAERVLLTVYGVGYRLALPAVHDKEAALERGFMLGVDSEIPGHPRWRLQSRIEAADAGELWRLVHAKTGEKRLVLIATSPATKMHLVARVSAHVQLARALPHRQDLLRLLEVNAGSVPAFAEFTPGHVETLLAWATSGRQLEILSDNARISLALAYAEAVAAAHAVGVAHGSLDDNGFLAADVGHPLPTVCVAGFSVLISDFEDAAFRAAVKKDVAAVGRLMYRLHVGQVDAVVNRHWREHVQDPLLADEIERTRSDTAGPSTRDMAELCERLRDLPARRERKVEADRAQALLLQRELELAIAKRRRRVALASTAVLGALSAICLMFYIDARQARDEARQAEASARAVSDFMVEDMLGQAEPFYGAGADMRLADLLDLAEGSVDERFADAPMLAADVYYALGRVRMGLGDLEDGERLLQRSLSLAGGAWPEDHPSRIATEFQLGDLMVRRARFVEARSRYHKVLADSTSRYGADHARSLWVRAELAWLEHELGESAIAHPLLAEVIAASDAWRTDDPGLRELAEHYLALVEVELGRFADAERRYRALRRDVVARRGEEHAAVAQIDRNIGAMLVAQSRHGEALQRLRPALMTMSARVGPEHPESLALESEMGAALLGLGQVEEALVLLQHAANGRRSQLGITHDRTRHTLSHYARALHLRGLHDEAERLAREVLVASEDAVGGSHPESALFRYRLAALLVERGQVDLARPLLEAAHADTHRRYGDAHPRVVEIARLRATVAQRDDEGSDRPRLVPNAARGRGASIRPPERTAIATVYRGDTTSRPNGTR